MPDTVHDMQPVLNGKKFIVLRSRQFGSSFFSLNDSGKYEVDWYELLGGVRHRTGVPGAVRRAAGASL